MTGFVGLVNNQHGEKAYASALVQMLFHIPCFRKAILEIPGTIPIKSLFLCLESSKTTVSMETLGVSGNTLKKGLLEIFASLNEKMKVCASFSVMGSNVLSRHDHHQFSSLVLYV